MARVTAFARGLAAIIRVVSLAITSLTEGEHPMRFLGHDITSAARRLRRSPLYTRVLDRDARPGDGASTSVYASSMPCWSSANPCRIRAGRQHLSFGSTSMYGRQEISWPDSRISAGTRNHSGCRGVASVSVRDRHGERCRADGRRIGHRRLLSHSGRAALLGRTLSRRMTNLARRPRSCFRRPPGTLLCRERRCHRAVRQDRRRGVRGGRRHAGGVPRSR